MVKKEIKITVTLDENNMPREIEWGATDAGFEGTKQCNSMMLHLWDKEAENSLSIDLWTKDMLIHHMHLFLLQNFMQMADSFQRATGKKELADMIRNFARQFMAKVNETKKENH